MKKWLAGALVAFFATSYLPASQDTGFRDGRAFSNSVKGKGDAALKSKQTENLVPGATSNPPETGYYGGVQGTHTNLGNKGLEALLGTEHGRAAFDAYRNNPKPAISMDADFLKPGWEAQANADKVVGGSQMCTPQTLQKNTFENFTCTRDPAVHSSCRKFASIDGTWSERTTYKTIVITPVDMSWTKIPTPNSPIPSKPLLTFRGTYVLSEKGAIVSQFIQLLGPNKLWSISHPSGYVPNKSFINDSATYNTSYPQQFAKGTTISLDIRTLYSFGANSPNPGNFRLTFNLALVERFYVPHQVWTDQCPTAGVSTPVGSPKCTQGPETRTVVMEGKPYSIFANCWEYTTTLQEQTADEADCKQYAANPNCVVAGRRCSLVDEAGLCVSEGVTYQCQTTVSSNGQVCGGDFYCTDGTCDALANDNPPAFAHAISQLAAVSAAASDASDQIDINIGAFTGNPQHCRKAAAGFNNCCANGGWGASAGLSHCNSEEMALGKAKMRKLVIPVGEYCSKKVLGVCIQKKRGHCVFESKLAKIVQEQGRLGQLRIGFGSGKKPNCRAITIPELQQLDFSLMNFQDFYEDLQDNIRIPDVQELTDQIKNQIATEAERLGQ